MSSGVLGARIELHEGEGAVAPPRGAGQPVILAQRYVPTGLGSRYRKAGVPYIDSGGNAWLSFPGFVTQVQGREPAYVLRPGKDRPSRAFRSTGLRVVFALLTQPGLVSATVRRIAAASTVSVGAAQAALHDLRAEGFLHDGHDRARTMTDEGKLAHRWVAGYGTELGPRLSAVELVGPGPKWWMKQDGLDVAAQGQVGGEAALAVLGYGIRPLTTTLYGDEPWHGLRRVGRLRRGADSNVILRERFWTPPEAGTGVLVPRLLTYADAVASDDPRQMEVAEQMRRTDEELRCLSHGG